jgi:hypothetical protein
VEAAVTGVRMPEDGEVIVISLADPEVSGVRMPEDGEVIVISLADPAVEALKPEDDEICPDAAAPVDISGRLL